ncbi:unnamed protein product [Arctogadus glacialis]
MVVVVLEEVLVIVVVVVVVLLEGMVSVLGELVVELVVVVVLEEVVVWLLMEGASNQHTLPQACSRPDLGSSDLLTGGSTGEEGPPAAGPRRVWRLEAEGGSLCSPPVNPFPIQLLP